MKTALLGIGFVMILLFGCTESGGVQATGFAGSDDTIGICDAGGECDRDAGLGDAYVSIPLSDVSTTLEYYTYDAGGTTVKYFAVLGSDGEPRVAFDACEVCFRSKKGYSQVGASVHCNNCGLQFRIDDLGEENKGAGCWPSHLEHKIESGHVMLKKSDIEAGASLFS